MVARIKIAGSEDALHQQIADYLRMQYPNVLFHSDFGSGIKLTIGQAAKQKRLQGGRRAWPDIQICEVRHGAAGLFIELKKEGTRLWKKDGLAASDHIAEQQTVGIELMKRGYKFTFCVGFEEAKKVIDSYLKG